MTTTDDPESSASSPVPERPTRAERVARGKASRKVVSRARQGEWAPATSRRNPVEILAEQATTREPDLIPIRHGRMLVSPFTFYRGAAAIMAADLAETTSSGFRVQLCGDAHLLNFGGFASAERHLVFDVNDFDETLPGPWEWDVKRLIASLEVAGRAEGLKRAHRQSAVAAGAAQYRRALADFAKQSALEVWYARLDVATVAQRLREELGRSVAPRMEKRIAGARTRDSMRALRKLTTVEDGVPRIVADPPLVVPLRDLMGAAEFEQRAPEIEDLFDAYRGTLPADRRRLLEQFAVADIARKVVGVGSIGTRCWLMLLMGRDDGAPLFLQMKEAQRSVLAPFAGESEFENDGERVVQGQRLMQATGDIFLGWIRAVGIDGRERDFYVRQLWDWKLSVDPAKVTPAGLVFYAQICAWTMARAHARSGDRIAIASYLGNGSSFDRAMVEFAEAYADQNERDYATFAAAVQAGTVEALEGV